jgi:polyisoprenoid-binding protein YceI
MIVRFTLFATLLALAGITSAQADNYKIDPAHSTILFKVGPYMGIGNIYGRFDTFSGNFVFDANNPAQDSVNVEINADSIDSNSAARDKDLKGPDFLNAKQFPTATFKSTAVKKVDDKDYEVTGDFTLRGITKPITLVVQVIGTGPGPKGETRIGTESTVTLKRSDFDVKAMLPAIPDNVQLKIAVEAVKQ